MDPGQRWRINLAQARAGPACSAVLFPFEGMQVMWIRILAAVAVFASALIHLEQWIVVFQHTAIVGPAMLVNFAGGVVITVLLLLWRHWIPLALTVLFGASTLGAFLVSVTVGLFGVHEHWTGWIIFTAAAVEIAAIILGLVGLWNEQRRHPAPRTGSAPA